MPTPNPTPEPTFHPTTQPPTRTPTAYPSRSPSASPSKEPSTEPTAAPSPPPSPEPSSGPTPMASSDEPSENPTATEEPSENPTQSEEPSENPTASEEPSELPTQSEEPTELAAEPTDSPTSNFLSLYDIVCLEGNQLLFGTFCEVIDLIPGMPEFLGKGDGSGGRKLQFSNRRYTLFAPTNAAFKNSDLELPDLKGNLTEDDTKLLKFIATYHIIGNNNVLTFDELTCDRRYTMFNGVQTQTRCSTKLKGRNSGVQEKYQIGTNSSAFSSSNTNPNLIFVLTQSDSKIVNKEIFASNGILHPVNRLILPDLSIYE
mmetsp:Transcript_23262/g.47409  ORF Transcript_23262/g.47409 Transcript_23262/m.47409 type:complete len:316 (+) Transcript_23262:1439-2386(+)